MSRGQPGRTNRTETGELEPAMNESAEMPYPTQGMMEAKRDASMPAAQSPTDQAPTQSTTQMAYVEGQPQECQLDFTDLLSYLNAVKVQFQDQLEVYSQFLDIIKDFKGKPLDTLRAIRRVSRLFSGYPTLIRGFNVFLPIGYHIECSMDPQDSAIITVTTVLGTMVQSTRDEPTSSGGFGGSQGSLPRVDGPTAGSSNTLPSDIEPAVQYVQEIK